MFLQSSIIERLADPELQMFPTFDNSHRLRMCNLTGFIGDIHAVIEFVPQSSGMVGWVDYMFAKPGQTELSQKWTYVKKVMTDGISGLVAD